MPELCPKHGVSGASIYKWKAKFGGMDVSEAKRLRSLEDENAKIKWLLGPSRGLKANRCRAEDAKLGKWGAERPAWKNDDARFGERSHRSSQNRK